MIQIMRYDRRPEPRAGEICADWRGWLGRNGYTIFSSLEVNSAGMAVLIEIFRGAEPEPYVLYHPSFRPAGLRETLYLLPDEDAMENLLQRAQVMLATLMATEAKRRGG
jgi:hypothetical protein